MEKRMTRLPKESFKKYQTRRKRENKQLKDYLRYGKNIWNSTKSGAYIRKLHGEIGKNEASP